MDVMLDLETLATSPNSVILTFGAIKFCAIVIEELNISNVMSNFCFMFFFV
jgi:hypothetical protein